MNYTPRYQHNTRIVLNKICYGNQRVRLKTEAHSSSTYTTVSYTHLDVYKRQPLYL